MIQPLRMLILGLFLLLSFWARGTHIVGGEINYRCLGGDVYEITLQVYRDCLNGVPYFDEPASIGIFLDDNTLFQQVFVQPMGDDTLDLVLDNPCLVIPPEVCYHSTLYQTTVTLPFVSGGYQLVYQRCCRNQSIVNIQLPLETGATFYNFISEEALTSCNSSAVFNAWPPFYICKDLPFVFDHFATDLDGDSIVYSMCAPFDGASFDDPRPQPPFNPPYDSVVWVNPPYNTQDMLGGIPLSIDENGLLTAVPNTLGQFVVGICAQEYRNGQLISTSRRDFQFNVGVCDLQIVSSFFAPEVQCEDDLTIFFNNQSNGADNFLWDFGDGTTSTGESVTHTFPDSGLYEITLIAGVGNACADTSVQTVNVQYESIFTEFDVAFETCEDSVVVNLIDLSVDTLSEIVAWRWDFGNGESSEEQFPSIQYTSPGVYTITLGVVAANGCTAEHSEQVTINIPFADFQNSQTICPGDGPVQLNPGGDPALQYLWSPADGLSDPTSPNPLASPSTTTTYSVSTFIPNTQDTCFVDREVTVFISPDVTLAVPNDTAVCDIGFQLIASSNADNPTFEWSLSPDFQSLLNENGAPDFIVNQPIDATYYSRVTNAFGCSVTDSLVVDFRGVLIEISQPDSLCFGDSLLIVATNQNAQDQLTFNWLPPDAILDGQGTPQILVAPEMSTTIILETANQIGCTRVDSVRIEVAPPLSVDAGLDQATCDEQVTLMASGINNNGFYEWSLSPDFDGLINQNGTANIDVIPGANTFYYVRTFNELGCEVVDTVLVQGQSVNIDLIGEDRICFPDTSVLEVINLDPNDDLTYSWSPLETIIPPSDGAIVQVNPTAMTIYTVVAENQFGCTQSAEFTVDVSSNLPPLEVAAEPDSIFAGQTVQLTSTIDPDYSYQWFPPNSLSDPLISDPVASPIVTTTYVLTINDEFNCRNQAEVTVFLKSFTCDDPFIFVPNAFTPNGDGLNDLLFVRGNIITDLYFAVYNRWGEKVFETEDQSIGWDGQFRGQQLPPDVFGYYLRAVCLDGQEFFKKGNVSILR